MKRDNTDQSDGPDNNRLEMAGDMRAAYDALSPFIERHSEVVCPECEKVCCIDKHCYYDDNDLVFLTALGIEVRQNLHDREDTGPCRYMEKKGCALERWERPYRCTYFFCDALLKSLEEDSALYNVFLFYLRYLVDSRNRLLISYPCKDDVL